jgi:hypothetical protein
MTAVSDWNLAQTGLTAAVLSVALFSAVWQLKWLRASRSSRAALNLFSTAIVICIATTDLLVRSWRAAFFQRVALVVLFSFYVFVYDSPVGRTTARWATVKVLVVIAVFCVVVLLVPIKNGWPARSAVGAVSLLFLVPISVSCNHARRAHLTMYGQIFVVSALLAGAQLMACDPFRAYAPDNKPLWIYYLAHTVELYLFVMLSGGAVIFSLALPRLPAHPSRNSPVHIDLKKFILSDEDAADDMARELAPLNHAAGSDESRTESL